MKISRKKFLTGILFLLAGIFLLSANVSAVVPPYLTFGGNYYYDAATRELSFTDVTAYWIEYTDTSYGFDDPILYAALSFGTLMNSAENNLGFGPPPGGTAGSVDFSIDGFITANLYNFVVVNGDVEWAGLSNITPVSGAPDSRYVNELLANGGGGGIISMNFTKMENGNPEDFIATSSGAFGGIVAAPEPASAILFAAGSAVLAFRRYRKKRI
ncbi:MAG: hypothetical protein HZA10_01900 [Nitrospirae bacterium]|nr:hypothetical protein [Nitrospirota bacterium]